MIRVLLLIAGVATMAAAQDEAYLWNDEEPQFLRRGIIIATGSFDEEHLTAACKYTLEGRGDFLFIQLTLVSHEQGARPRPKIDHMTYSYWKKWHDASAKSQEPVAEMIFIKGDALLRMRDADGHVRQKVIQGKNPLVFDADGATFDVLYFSFSEPHPPVIQLKTADIYMQSSRPASTHLGEALLKLWQPLLPGFAVSLLIRVDRWFLYNSSFPFFYPFGEEGEPPSEDAYRGTQTLRCQSWFNSPPCAIE
jgi:hypothetical protein